MSERISDTNNGTVNSEARTPRFNRSKTVQVIISILVALALWVYVDVEKAPERTKTIRDVPVEFSGENTTLADKNLMLGEKVSHMGQRTTRAKIMSYLSAQAQKSGAYEFDIPFSRQQLADYLAVERSGLSVELCKMRDEGLLEFHKSHFVLKV